MRFIDSYYCSDFITDIWDIAIILVHVCLPSILLSVQNRDMHMCLLMFKQIKINESQENPVLVTKLIWIMYNRKEK